MSTLLSQGVRLCLPCWMISVVIAGCNPTIKASLWIFIILRRVAKKIKLFVRIPAICMMAVTVWLSALDSIIICTTYLYWDHQPDFLVEHMILDTYLERAADERYEAQMHPASGKSGIRAWNWVVLIRYWYTNQIKKQWDLEYPYDI